MENVPKIQAPRRTTRTRKRTMSSNQVPNPFDDGQAGGDTMFIKQPQENKFDLLGLGAGDFGTGANNGGGTGAIQNPAKLDNNIFDMFDNSISTGAKESPSGFDYFGNPSNPGNMGFDIFDLNDDKKQSVQMGDFAISLKPDKSPEFPANPFEDNLPPMDVFGTSQPATRPAGISDNPFDFGFQQDFPDNPFDFGVDSKQANTAYQLSVSPDPKEHRRIKSAPQLQSEESEKEEHDKEEDSSGSKSDGNGSASEGQSSGSDDDDDGFDDEQLNMQQSAAAPARPALPSLGHIRSQSLAPKQQPRQHRRGVSVDAGRRQHELQLVTEEKDALKVMKEGTSFLKYGRMGYPHFRLFHLSPDNQSLVWYSKNKKRASTKISIHDIDQIISGQKTKNFHRHRAPELARSSFSIIYGNQRKSLDVVAKSPQEHALWVQGLESLREAALKNEAQDMNELIIRLKTYKRVGAASGTSPSSSRGKSKSGRDKYSSSKALKELQALQKIWHKFDTKLNSRKLSQSSDFEHASSRVQKLRGIMDEVALMIRKGMLDDIDYRLWQVAVEIEAIENMLHVLSS